MADTTTITNTELTPPRLNVAQRMSLQPPPTLDYAALAKVTKKVVDRLAPFCQMWAVEEIVMGPSSAPAPSQGPTSTSTTNTAASPPPQAQPGSAFSSPGVTPSPSIRGGVSTTTTPPAANQNQKLVSRITKTVLTKLMHAVDAHIEAGEIGRRVCAGVCEGIKGKNKAKIPKKNQTKTQGGGDKTDSQELLRLAKKGLELSKRAEELFGKGEVRQEVYKIAAQTKNQPALEVLIVSSTYLSPVGTPSSPPVPASSSSSSASSLAQGANDPSKSGESQKVERTGKHLTLKEVGSDLVASLNLLEMDFGRRVGESVGWWEWVVGELQLHVDAEAEEDPESAGSSPDEETDDEEDDKDKDTTENLEILLKPALTWQHIDWWTQAKEGWEGYHEVVSVLYATYGSSLLPSASPSPPLHLPSAEKSSGTGEARLGVPAPQGVKTDGSRASDHYEVLERQTVPRSGNSEAGAGAGAGGVEEAQDKAAAKRSKSVKGFMMWRGKHKYATATPAAARGEEPNASQNGTANGDANGEAVNGEAKENLETTTKKKGPWWGRLWCFGGGGVGVEGEGGDPKASS